LSCRIGLTWWWIWCRDLLLVVKVTHGDVDWWIRRYYYQRSKQLKSMMELEFKVMWMKSKEEKMCIYRFQLGEARGYIETSNDVFRLERVAGRKRKTKESVHYIIMK
jgi:hypothetical protein